MVTRVSQTASAVNFDVRRFGNVAEGEDISTALAACVTAACAERNAVVNLPQGQYNLNSLAAAAFPASGSSYPTHRVTIDGAGCILNVPTGNTTGGLKITKYNNFQTLAIRDLTILSDHAYDGETTGGIGLEVVSDLEQGDSGWGAAGYSEVFLDNVVVGTDRAAEEGRWNTGIKITNCWYPRLSRCDATTRFEFDLPDNGDYESGAGIEFSGCYSPELHGCRAIGKWDVGIKISDDDQPAYEYFSLIDCQSFNSRIALLVDHEDSTVQSTALKEPGGQVLGGHYNGAQSSIEIRHHQSAFISNTLLYLTNPDQATSLTTYSDAAYVRLHDCHEIHVCNNMMNFGGHYDSDSDCSSGVRLEGTTEYCLIDGNRLYHDGIAVNNQATGTNNVMRRNIISGRGAGTAGAPTKNFLDASNLMQIEDEPISFNPTLAFGGGSTGITYSTRTGEYTRTGNKINGYVHIVLTSKGTDTGSATIDLADIPTPETGTSYGVTVTYTSGMNQSVHGGLIPNSGTITLLYRATNDNMNATVDDADFSGTDTLRLSFEYVTE